MSKKLFSVLVVLAIGLFAVSTASATVCPTGTYALYNPAPPGGGPSITCTVGADTFSNFEFFATAGGGAVLISPSGVLVTPIIGVDGPGFDFNPGMVVGPGQTQDVRIEFQVTAAPGTSINDLFIAFNGGATNGGSTNFTETYCTAGFLQGTCNSFSVTNPPPNFNNLITGLNFTTLFIIKDVAISGGTGGNASVSDFQNQFSSPVPEPASIALFGTGLVGLAGVLRRRLKK
jgi:hypothetical protein